MINPYGVELGVPPAIIHFSGSFPTQNHPFGWHLHLMYGNWNDWCCHSHQSTTNMLAKIGNIDEYWDHYSNNGGFLKRGTPSYHPFKREFPYTKPSFWGALPVVACASEHAEKCHWVVGCPIFRHNDIFHIVWKSQIIEKHQ